MARPASGSPSSSTSPSASPLLASSSAQRRPEQEATPDQCLPRSRPRSSASLLERPPSTASLYHLRRSVSTPQTTSPAPNPPPPTPPPSRSTPLPRSGAATPSRPSGGRVCAPSGWTDSEEDEEEAGPEAHRQRRMGWHPSSAASLGDASSAREQGVMSSRPALQTTGSTPHLPSSSLARSPLPRTPPLQRHASAQKLPPPRSPALRPSPSFPAALEGDLSALVREMNRQLHLSSLRGAGHLDADLDALAEAELAATGKRSAAASAEAARREEEAAQRAEAARLAQERMLRALRDEHSWAEAAGRAAAARAEEERAREAAARREEEEAARREEDRRRAREEERLEEEKRRRREEQERKDAEEEAKRVAVAAEREAVEEARRGEAATRQREVEAAAAREAASTSVLGASWVERSTPGARRAAVDLLASLEATRAAARAFAADATRREAKRAVDRFVTLHVQQIAATQAQVRAKGQALAAALGGVAEPGQRAYALLTLAAKFCIQCEVQVTRLHSFAFPLAEVAVAVGAAHPDFVPTLLGQLIKSCPLLVPRFGLFAPGGDEDAYFKWLGYKIAADEDAKEVTRESTDECLGRVQGYVRFYAALMQSDNPQNPHGLKQAWTYLARLLNGLPATRFTATALDSFLAVAGFRLVRAYKRQAFKLLEVVRASFLPELSAAGADDPDAKAVYTRIGTFLATRAYDRAPEGRDMPESDASSYERA